jgi:hypothetical protein
MYIYNSLGAATFVQAFFKQLKKHCVTAFKKLNFYQA